MRFNIDTDTPIVLLTWQPGSSVLCHTKTKSLAAKLETLSLTDYSGNRPLPYHISSRLYHLSDIY